MPKTPSLLALVMAAAIALLGNSTAHAQTGFNPVFGDHGVLQRDSPIALWGQASADETVTVELADRRATATADSDGVWRTTLPGMPAGGPYTLRVTGSAGQSQTLSDIMIGDVFLCSGQSNMELQVKAAMSAEREIRSADHPGIRLYNVPQAIAAAPRARLQEPGEWKPATSANVGDFSAACYFFARDLQRDVDVPIGLISASWGGSAIESWIGADELSALGHADEIALLRRYDQDPAAAKAEFGRNWENWWARSQPGQGKPWRDAADAGWTAVPVPMRDWKTWGEADLKDHNGMLWYRRSVTLSAEQAAQANKLHLGAIDEIDMTWVNGVAIGSSFGWGTDRDYALPPGLLRAGRNDIVVNVFSAWDMGGMFGPADAMSLELTQGGTVPLGGDWQYRKVPAGAGEPPKAPWFSIGGLGTMGNAMISPIAPYGLRGAIWYQGESNAGHPDGYQALLAALMRDWRGRFDRPDLPFLIVQLPNFGTPTGEPSESGWAELREAQRRAVLDDDHAGLAVTIDAGVDDDLHPPQKQIVGTRLARLAEETIYGRDVHGTGPVPLSAERSDGAITVRFAGMDGDLVAYSSNRPIAFQLCGAEPSSCRYADARLEGRAVRLTGDGVPGATRIRYCWADAPTCNLYDSTGLPAVPFELSVP